MAYDIASVHQTLHLLGMAPRSVVPIAGGAWSSAFRCRLADQEVVLRLGGSAEDYAADAFAATLARDDLPIPGVLAHGTLDAGALIGTTYAISEYVPGTPLEQVSPATWAALVPQLVDIYEVLRKIAPQPSEPSVTGWRDHLLQVGTYPWQAGWRQRAHSDALEMFDRGLDLLRDLAPAAAPVSLIHADWINRNVHVAGDRIAGIFDWGCSRFGDHLYDLAWLEFWAPWHPNLDVPLLVRALQNRWDAVGIAPLEHPGRRRACLLHIGLDHIVYNILHGTEEALAGTMARLDRYL